MMALRTHRGRGSSGARPLLPWTMGLSHPLRKFGSGPTQICLLAVGTISFRVELASRVKHSGHCNILHCQFVVQFGRLASF